MASKSISSDISTASDGGRPINSSDAVELLDEDVGDSDVVDESVVVFRVEKEAKYAYAAASGKTNILRISRPTLGCRKSEMDWTMQVAAWYGSAFIEGPSNADGVVESKFCNVL